jgi:ubiquinone/menaquinone biosynthesis C-methylase UbiE
MERGHLVTNERRRRRLRAALVVACVVTVAALAMRRMQAPADGGVRDATGVRRLYDRVAPLYDLLTAPYRWVGAGRVGSNAIQTLGLGPGDTVVDLGTGTGRNLLELSKAVGPTGKVLGVDISPGMLERAAKRVRHNRSHNVTLIEADIATYQPPADTAAVIATYAMEMLPNYDDVIARLAATLPAGARIALTGMREPARWPEWLIRIGSAANRPFGVNPAYRTQRPWQSIEHHLDDTTYTEAFAGAVYTAVGAIPNSDDAGSG